MMKKLIVFFIFLIAISGCKGQEKSPKSDSVQPLQDQTVSRSKDIQKEESLKQETTVERTKPNQPPRVVSVDVSPEYPRVGDTIKITANAVDPDGDKINLIYEWFKNNEKLLETSDSMTLTKDFKRGDMIKVNVIPHDGTIRGSIGIVKATVANSPPEILSSPSENKIDNRKFIYQIRAVDKDNDPISYSLKNAPSGMTINAVTGLIQWNIPSEFKGSASVNVLAVDNHGGEAVQSFTFEVNR